MDLLELERSLSECLGLENDFVIRACSGGDTHNCYELFSQDSPEPKAASYFVKVNSADQASILETEAESLRAVASLFPNAYPTFIAYKTCDELSILVMSFHQIEAISASTAAESGSLLAKQHAITNDQCGWHQDNFIGSSPQKNSWLSCWSEFFTAHRLEPQFSSAIENGLPAATANKIEQIIDSPPSALTEHTPEFALLHGDLWSGNAAYDSAKFQPLFYDPAPYFGDPECDIAMTQLFGAFPKEFYTSYHTVRPALQGHEIRRELYNLYHSLNHFNLFGSIYLNKINNNLLWLC